MIARSWAALAQLCELGAELCADMAEHHKRVEIVKKEFEQARKLDPSQGNELRREEQIVIGVLKSRLWDLVGTKLQTVSALENAAKTGNRLALLSPRAREILAAVSGREGASSERPN